jgi:signal transduction histidine kinase
MTDLPRTVAEIEAKLRSITRERDVALEQQAATAGILKVIASSRGDAQPVFDRILQSIEHLLGVEDRAIFLISEDGLLHIGAAFGPNADRARALYPVPLKGSASELAIRERRLVRSVDVLNYADLPTGLHHFAEHFGQNHAMVIVPLVSDERAIGSMFVARTSMVVFSDSECNLLRKFADQAVIAIENARLFNDTREALERQTATSEILRIISQSPSDVTPVFDAIAERARVLCGALLGATTRYDGELLHLVGYHGVSPKAEAVMRSSFPRKPDLSSINGRCILAKAPVQIADVEIDPQYQLTNAAKAADYRSLVAVPMLQGGDVIGVIAVTRKEPGEFPVKLIDLLQTFADQAVIAVENARLFHELQARTRELSKSLDDLRAAQDRLVQTEKLASLGQLTAGIAHEIKNPLNFVNNFSSLSAELVDELDETLAPAPLEQKMRGDVGELTQMLKSNLEKVVQHGKRADSIVKNMLQHSREGSGERRSTDINAIVEDSLNLAYHGARAEKSGFSITLQHDLDPRAGVAEVYPQEITRALLNLISNGFYAATRRQVESGDDGFEPVLSVSTKDRGETVEIRLRDNGAGIPAEITEKMFVPFFTTKPTGEGTGLGLSITHDIIVKQHGGRIDVETEPGTFTEFIVTLPRHNGATVDRKS